MTELKFKTELPDNAFRELNEGEKYEPVMPTKANPREVTAWSLCLGLLMAVIFSAATAYLGLKVGQVFEAAIPITIIAVGLAGATKRKDPLGENVIIQSIGACSGMIVAGAIFTLPALYILQNKFPDADISVSFLEVFLASLLGGVIGILFLIPFRKYFVKDMHGKYPFPEATASTQVLMSGEGGGSSAKPLIIASVIGGLFDFLVATFGAWAENFTSAFCSAGVVVAEKAKLFFSINTSAALLGMGYIVGLKYAAIMCAGSALIWWVVVPGIGLLMPDLELAGGTLAGDATPQAIFQYAKSIGIGGIAMAGIIGVWNSRKVIIGSVDLINKAFSKGAAAEGAEMERTDKDLSMKIVAIALVIALLTTLLFFYLDVMGGSILFTVVALLIVFIIAFLFTTVAANAIAIVGSNPVSGMTLMTLILASLIMAAVGLNGTSGMVAALIMGGVVCTALSSAGSFVTDLKIGYWLGSTPAKQQTYKFLGILISAATAAGVIMILNKTYGFTPDNSDVMAAPQARAMAAVIEPLMMGEGAPWLLYGIGAVISLIMNACGISALAFALGMFIPLQLNLPLIVGGAINWYVTKPKADTAEAKDEASKRGEKGTLLASGFIAGGALMGVVSAILRFVGYNPVNEEWFASSWAEILSLVMYILLIVYLVKATKK